MSASIHASRLGLVPLPDREHLPLPVLIAALHPLSTARDAAELVAAVRLMRGTVPDADLYLAAFFRLLAIDYQLPPAFSYLLAHLIEMQDSDA